MTTSTGYTGAAGQSGGGGGFEAGDWASVIQGVGQGTEDAFAAHAANVASKKEAKELKRRTLANLLKKALMRDLAMYKADVGHQDEMSDMQGDAMQQVARGFADSLRGATTQGRMR